MSHPCKYWGEDGCGHVELPHGKRPSGGICRKVCRRYEGPDRGLGDTVARFTKLTGIDKVVEHVARAAGKECGCGARRARLNGVVPFKKADTAAADKP